MSRKRRGRGEGSICQRADGLWVAVVENGRDAKGRRRRKYLYAKTKTEVREKLKTANNQPTAATLGDGAAMSVAQYLNHWLTTVHVGKVEPNTSDRSEELIRLHLIPQAGDIKLAKLNSSHVEQLMVDLKNAGNSDSSIRRCVKLLRSALKHAVEKKHILPSNATMGVDLPKVTKEDIHPFDAAQVARFLKFAVADRLYAYFVLAIDSGMRAGEMNGLQWGDVDLDRGSVQVQRSLEERNAQHRLKPTKTKSSKRRIDLSKFALDALHDHRKRMLAEGSLKGKESQVFVDTEGGFIRRSNLHRNNFKRIIKRANEQAKEDAAVRGDEPFILPDIRLHDLRHTCATLLLMEGYNPKIVAERLGHSKIQTTLDTYSHVLPTMQEKAAQAMNSLFGKMAL